MACRVICAVRVEALLLLLDRTNNGMANSNSTEAKRVCFFHRTKRGTEPILIGSRWQVESTRLQTRCRKLSTTKMACLQTFLSHKNSAGIVLLLARFKVLQTTCGHSSDPVGSPHNCHGLNATDCCSDSHTCLNYDHDDSPCHNSSLCRSSDP